VIGVTLVKGTETANDLSMHLGDTTTISGYTFHFTDLKNIKGPNYIAAQGTFEVTQGDTKVATMKPEKRLFSVQQMPMTEAAINRGFTRDLYVSLGEKTSDNVWIVRVQHKPFVSWIWAGCLIIAFGGFLAASDRRYRIASRKKKGGASAVGDVVDVHPISEVSAS
jgi:cytochrome c-type biogenesis protein CcmF